MSAILSEKTLAVTWVPSRLLLLAAVAAVAAVRLPMPWASRRWAAMLLLDSGTRSLQMLQAAEAFLPPLPLTATFEVPGSSDDDDE